MAKGGNFERQLSRDLSLWFSSGKNEDWFWRSSQSGGRATTRRRKGKTTAGHAGDIAATCSEGEPLTRFVTIEAKSGYSAACVFNLFDKAGTCDKTWAGWIAQASAAAETAGSPHWCVIHRRDRRDAVIAVPNELADALFSLGCLLPTRLILDDVSVLRLKDFFAAVEPQDIRTLLARSKK